MSHQVLKLPVHLFYVLIMLQGLFTTIPSKARVLQCSIEWLRTPFHSNTTCFLLAQAADQMS